MNNVKRIYVEKKNDYAVSAKDLYNDIRDNLGIKSLTKLRIVNRYDISGITEEEYKSARNTIFSEPTVDNSYDEIFNTAKNERVFAMEYLPGQYDQRADSAAQCLQILTQKERPEVKTAKLIVLSGDISDIEFEKIKNYCINPLESREASLDKPVTLEFQAASPEDVKSVDGFIYMDENRLADFMDRMGFAMNYEDLKFCQEYFRDTEKRDPTVTELRVIDTYWSDHCRHTTFHTAIEDIEIEKGKYTEAIETALKGYLEARAYVYNDAPRDINLMDMAVIGMKEQKKKGLLPDLEVSDEINACSITVNADIDGRQEEWLVMFKNETHNHPTEIEPFGGAATCLGGAIRDPLSGRSYVYGAMRVTGSADPRRSIEDTLPGKLPQRKITTGAAAGYSSYGNQIGLATGQVSEVYDEDFVAKRMEIGAVIGAAPRSSVVRKAPVEGDVIVLLGGRTGRDGCGGATGSSKEHTEESIQTCGAEVQKGNAPTERKIQRLFRNPSVSRLIKKCNDFGAGGISVAIGELADGLDIDLDIVPKKYEGLDGTELAISESQERMAVLVSAEDAEGLINHAAEENLEAVIAARVTSTNRLRMQWRGQKIVDIGRDFLNTNGVKQKTQVVVKAPENESFFGQFEGYRTDRQDIKDRWLENLKDLNVCSQKGLVERFDSTIGTGSVLMPFGGRYQETPSEGLAMKLPVMSGETNTATVMTWGYNPRLAKWSPFHGAVYAVVESVTKVAALGGDYRKVRLTLQEYFEKLGKDPEKWGKPASALLGALYAQRMLGVPAIGGKDSMSGTFKDINVPPTLVSFAVDVAEADKIVSQEFKKAGSTVVLLRAERDGEELPDFERLHKIYAKAYELIQKGLVLSTGTVKTGGMAATISRMCFGNMLGFSFEAGFETKGLFTPDYGSVILELEEAKDLDKLFDGIAYEKVGKTQDEKAINIDGIDIELEKAHKAWRGTLERIFHTGTEEIPGKPQNIHYNDAKNVISSVKVAKPRIFIPVFPGTNCEYDTARAFEKAGGIPELLVFRNITPSDIEASIKGMVKGISNAQIIALPGGFSSGDEPEGSGKFIATVFRNPEVKEAVMKLLKERDGLMLGICNGFQALIKLGLLPYGEIRDIDESSPTLTYNTIGRHVSCMVNTKVVSNLSPWFAKSRLGDIHTIAMSHGEGRFAASRAVADELIRNGQVATQYVDAEGNPTYDVSFNPNGSIDAIEGITSPDGRILGKMGHSERTGRNVAVNVPGDKEQKIFEAGVGYFR
ncbi:MAG TPA: phosphoribosylformylglycinamidine synthase [Negativicutes bacterium]|nr:phosphoribosylformylglycinamidine synthase [Negativicutes bacterium]